MFFPAHRSRIWLCTDPTDMRKSFTGLSAAVKHQLGHDPQGGDYFIFINRRQTQMKILYFEASGYCLWSKRLEQGQFNVKPATDGQRRLTQTDLQSLLDGIDIQKYRQFKRFRHAA